MARLRLALVVSATMLCFSANSLLTRGALGVDRIDWISFTLIRLASGAAMLALLVRLRRARTSEGGSWRAALALAAYAITFTYAYTRIGAAVGALLLFGAVQATMIGTGLVRGERPARVDWIGMALAVTGLLVLTLPGATAPDMTGAVLMLIAGVSWGVYSLIGRASRDPVAANAGNFLLATPMVLLTVGAWLPGGHLTWTGTILAVASGAVASGLGYSLWYTALPALAAWRAALVQLTVPVLTGLLAAALLSETISGRLVVAAACVLAGVAMSAVPAWHNGRAATRR